MHKLLPANAVMIGILFTAMPLYANQNGDMFGSVPALPPGQSDMLPSPTPQAPADMFQGQSAAPAPDMFPQQTPDAPSADMFDGASKGTAPEDVFPAHSAPAPPYPLYHNPNESGP